MNWYLECILMKNMYGFSKRSWVVWKIFVFNLLFYIWWWWFLIEFGFTISWLTTNVLIRRLTIASWKPASHTECRTFSVHLHRWEDLRHKQWEREAATGKEEDRPHGKPRPPLSPPDLVEAIAPPFWDDGVEVLRLAEHPDKSGAVDDEQEGWSSDDQSSAFLSTTSAPKIDSGDGRDRPFKDLRRPDVLQLLWPLHQ